MLLSRRARPAQEKGYDVLAVVLTCERMLIYCGIRFPAGGSRLLIAQRSA